MRLSSFLGAGVIAVAAFQGAHAQSCPDICDEISTQTNIFVGKTTLLTSGGEVVHEVITVGSLFPVPDMYGAQTVSKSVVDAISLDFGASTAQSVPTDSTVETEFTATPGADPLLTILIDSALPGFADTNGLGVLDTTYAQPDLSPAGLAFLAQLLAIGGAAPVTSDTGFFSIGSPFEFAYLVPAVKVADTGHYLEAVSNVSIYERDIVKTLSPTPEPSAWALMLLGVAALGLRLRASRNPPRESGASG